MLFLKFAIKNLLQNRFYTVVNILGLSIGLSCVIFILLYIQDELSYDKHHENYQRVYRLETDFTVSGRHEVVAKSPFPFGPTFKKDFPEVEEFVRFRDLENTFFEYKENVNYEDAVYLADSSIFKVFSHRFIMGNPENALNSPNTIVVTQSFAQRYFGKENPMGKVLQTGKGINCQVTGVIEDVPANSHLKFDALISMISYAPIIGEKMFHDLNTVHFWAIRLFTYVLLAENTSIESVHAKFPAFYDKYIADLSKRFNGTMDLQTSRLDKIHLYTKLGWDFPTGDIKLVYVFMLIAVFVMLIASINYMNLATARSVKRAKEVGIKKLLGAFRGQLSRQFIIESILITFAALVVALVLVETFLPAFNQITGKELDQYLTGNLSILLIIVGVTILVGFFSGSYPAFFLSAFKPVSVLKGDFSKGKRGRFLRKGLIILQFFVATTMILCSYIVIRQLQFMNRKDLGLKKENIVVFRIQDTTFRKSLPAFEAEIKTNPNVEYVAISNNVPGRGMYMDIMQAESDEGFQEQLSTYLEVDYDFFDLMGFTIEQGRKFDKSYGKDDFSGVIINETAAKKFGWGTDAIGRKINRSFSNYRECKVIGVVKDFHYQSLHNEIEPFLFFLSDEANDFMEIKIRDDQRKKTLAFLEKTWNRYNKSEPFLYFYLEELYDIFYSTDKNFLRIMVYFALISIFISLLGMFGLSSFITEQSTKSISLRKVLGASVSSIVYLFSKEFLLLVFLSFLISFPAAWLIMERWLDGFAYRIDIKFEWFLVTGIIVLMIAQLTVTFQSFRAAYINPVDVLKYE